MVDFQSNEDRIWNDSSNAIFKLIISDDIKYLSDNAFRDLLNLEIVEFSKTVESIGEYCFYNDNKLKSFDLPTSLRSIKKHAFDIEKSHDEKIIVLIPQSVTYLAENCLSKDYRYIVYENSEAVNYARKRLGF